MGATPERLVLSRPEHDPDGPVEAKRVVKTFVNTAPILEVQVGGQAIRTTPEHPFWVEGKGWVAACDLGQGDLLCSHDGAMRMVERVEQTQEVTTVYNVAVEEFHTYFVGSEEWRFSVWAHNAEYAVLSHPNGGYALAERQVDGSFRWVTDARVANPTAPRQFASVADAEAAIASGGGTRFIGATTSPVLAGPTQMPVLQTPIGHQA